MLNKEGRVMISRYWRVINRFIGGQGKVAGSTLVFREDIVPNRDNAGNNYCIG